MIKRRILSIVLAVMMIAAVLPFTSVISAAEETLPVNCFSDVKTGAWYADAVLYCYKYAYISGTGEAQFSPSVNMNRAMFVTILYNIDAASEKYSTSSFADVKTGTWYANPIEWAYQNGYASGTGKDAKGSYFSPTSPVTRETLCVFLRTYAQAKGFGVDPSADLSVYKDNGQIHSWAKNAVSWAVAEGLVSGLTKDTIAPCSAATRAQIALILKNFLGKYPVHVWDDEKVITERTCTVAGKSEFICADCGKTRTVDYKAWHTYDEGVTTKAATCGAEGEKTCTCKICGNKKSVAIPKLAKHSWNSGVVVEAPQCAKAGKKLFTCTVCGGTYTAEIPMTSHKFVNGHCTKCTAISNVTDLIAGTWGWSTLYIDGQMYSINSTITFNKNGIATLKIDNEKIDFYWQYVGISDGMPTYHISNSEESYYVLFDNNPMNGETYMHIFLVLDSSTMINYGK